MRNVDEAKNVGIVFTKMKLLSGENYRNPPSLIQTEEQRRKNNIGD